MEEVLVGILCYNHEDYVAQCLDSVLRQKCDFPFRVYVFDDVSTDRSWSIIQEYKERYGEQMIIEQPEHNTYSAGNRNAFLQFFEKVNKAEYVAFCEADDYWTDDCKLQKQHDVMQRNPDAALCIHDVELTDVSNGRCMGIVPGRINEEWSQKELITRILTYNVSFRMNSYFIRSESLKRADMYGEFWDYWAVDLSLLVYAALQGRMLYVSDNMAVKRVNNAGSLSHQANLEKNICRQQTAMFEEDIRWIGQFDQLTGGEYEDLLTYYKRFREIKLHYLYQGKLEQNKNVSNANGRMYQHEFGRKINRMFVRLGRKLCWDNECRFVRLSGKWMEKEWKRLQKR